MSNPKRPLPEQIATQIAMTLPGGQQQGDRDRQGDRRTAAMPAAPVPTAAPHERTMSFDAAMHAPKRREPLPTVMSMPQAKEDPPPSARPGNGRWVGGPLLAIVVGVLTAWLAGVISGPVKPPNLGHLRLSSDPEGATVIVEGKVQPHPTPTTIDGEIGATLHVGFRLEGYFDKDADVFVGEGERPFRAKLDSQTGDKTTHTQGSDEPPIEAPPPIPVDDSPPSIKSLAPPREEHTHSKKEPKPHTEKATPPVAPVAVGSGSLTVHVRPWAIVYVDGAKLRQTPVEGYTITAGMHVVELVNDVLKKREKVHVEVKNHGSEEVRRDWEK